MKQHDIFRETPSSQQEHTQDLHFSSLFLIANMGQEIHNTPQLIIQIDGSWMKKSKKPVCNLASLLPTYDARPGEFKDLLCNCCAAN